MKIERTAQFLFANLGSEITRFFGLRKRNMHDEAHLSIKRALGIIDSILVSNASKSAREEAMILRTVIIDLMQESAQFTVGERELQSFFLPFAQSVMRG